MTTDGEAIFDTTSQHVGDDQQRLIMARFVRATFTMHQIDELFSWITDLMVQQFHAQTAQIWANYQTQKGFILPELRSSSRQEQLLPAAMLSDPEVTTVAGNVLRAGRSFLPTLVDQSFSPPFALLLHRYRLNYSLGFFLGNSEVFLPAMPDAAGQAPTPLAITLLLFFRQVPSQHEFFRMNDIFQKVLPVARSRRLLMTASAEVPPVPAQPKPTIDIFELIPHRHEDPADNPLALAASIKDVSARRFYGAINGRRTVRELCALIGLERTESTVIVQKLLTLSCIKFYKSDGQVAESSTLFSNY